MGETDYVKLILLKGIGVLEMKWRIRDTDPMKLTLRLCQELH